MNTVLIVDDEKNTREGLRLSLEDEFDVYISSNIKGAKDVLENEIIDVLVTDLRPVSYTHLTLPTNREV